jgi:hypothetical protein
MRSRVVFMGIALAFAGVALALLVVGSGLFQPRNEAPAPPPGHPRAVPGGGGTSQTGPLWADLEAYRRRCARLNARGAWARVLYEAHKEMTRGDPEAVTAAVTLNQSTPPKLVLHRAGATAEPGVVVSCHVQAQLSASRYEFDVDAKDWVERSLETADIARWEWMVTPKVCGTQTIVLSVQPIVTVKAPAGTKEPPVPGKAPNVQQYEMRVHVNVPWTERPQETMSRLAATFKVAEGAVKALTGLIVAVLALLGVLGIRSWRKKRATS